MLWMVNALGEEASSFKEAGHGRVVNARRRKQNAFLRRNVAQWRQALGRPALMAGAKAMDAHAFPWYVRQAGSSLVGLAEWLCCLS